MGDEFFATIKIVTGEELVSKVCYIEDEDKLLLENPLQVDAAKTRRGQIEISGFSFKEWIFATFDNMFIINRDHVVTITEVEGPIVDFYNVTLQRMQNAKSLQGNGKKLSRGSGYLGSVKDMKKSLEDIFNKS